MAFVSIRARPAFGRGGWMKGEQGFGDSITASIDCPATAGRSRQAFAARASIARATTLGASPLASLLKLSSS